MKLTCIHKYLKNRTIVINYPENYALKEGMGIKEIPSFTCEYDRPNNTKRILLDGVNITFFNRTLKKDLIYKVQTNAPYLQMHFELNGNVTYTPHLPGKENYSIHAHEHALFYLPELNGQVVYPAGNNIFRIEIEISILWLMQVFNNDLNPLGEFAEHIQKQQPAILGGKSFPITREIQEVLMAIYRCKFTLPLKKLFIEGKLLELLSLQVNQMTAKKAHATKPALKKDDKERMYYIKDLLTENMHNPPSINDLANTACMNRTKLQTSFKAIFGNTIYGYLADERMKKAYALLVSSEYVKIAEIARKIGYKNPNHFSTAFKNKYGFSPKDIQIQ